MRHRLRTFFGIDDDLQAFAEGWLNRPSQLANALSLSQADGALVSVLYRDDRFQVELCAVTAGTFIPAHVHPNADTIEVSVSGALRLPVNGRVVDADVPDRLLARFNRWRGIRINHDDVHGGAVVPQPGAMFLSIQRWNVGPPKSVLTDYAGEPLGNMHRSMLQGQSSGVPT